MSSGLRPRVSIEVGQIWDAPTWPGPGARIVVLEALPGSRWLVWSELGSQVLSGQTLVEGYAPVGVSLSAAVLEKLHRAG